MPRDDDDDAIAEPKDDSLTYLVRKLRALLRSEAKDRSARFVREARQKRRQKSDGRRAGKGLKFGIPPRRRRGRDIIKYCDVDGDGEISYLEFEFCRIAGV